MSENKKEHKIVFKFDEDGITSNIECIAPHEMLYAAMLLFSMYFDKMKDDDMPHFGSRFVISSVREMIKKLHEKKD